MIDLSTEYLGLKLANPLVPSSSPLTGDLDTARQLEDAGASALVLPSLFEEAIEHEQKELERFVHSQALGSYEAQSYQPIPEEYDSELDNYLSRIEQFKSSLDIPVIASLNGISTSGWIDTGKELQQAGADALELNVYYIAADPEISGVDVENRYLQLLADLREHISIPVTMKLSSQFSSVANMVSKLQQAGAQGVSLFNRFYQPDIDLETLHIKPSLELSSSMESLLRIRWIALIRGRVDLSIAATGGFHQSEDIVKALLVGADVTHLCSVLLKKGPDHIAVLKQELEHWLQEHEYESVEQMKGSVSQSCAINPAALEHSNYMHVIKSYGQ
ncbi:MAG: dihydroorotate dehydrogenase-like protein [Gammaproteobacteria bacterium]|jgi:dihydroorotate dehydrogenase (fumarate)|nr:dihydroorotate dehydrogenase-like protein [Gammaproteobacteria bacterium]